MTSASGIVQLPRRQGPMRPVGEARDLVETGADDLRDQAIVGHRFTEAADHGGDLGVEDRRGQLAEKVEEDLQVLSGRMEDLQHLRIGQEPAQGGQVDAIGQGVDGDRVLGRTDLNQAELGPVGRVPEKLSIDGKEVSGGLALAEGRQFPRCRRSRSWRSYTRKPVDRKGPPGWLRNGPGQSRFRPGLPAFAGIGPGLDKAAGSVPFPGGPAGCSGLQKYQRIAQNSRGKSDASLPHPHLWRDQA